MAELRTYSVARAECNPYHNPEQLWRMYCEQCDQYGREVKKQATAEKHAAAHNADQHGVTAEDIDAETVRAR